MIDPQAQAVRMQRAVRRTRACALALLIAGAVPAQAAEITGRLDWSRRVELGVPVSGVIAEVPVQAGARVKKGQKLLALDTRRLRADVREAEAETSRFGEAAEEADREAKRADELFARTLLSQHELQVAKIEQNAARARRTAAEAKLARAKVDLGYAELAAPFDALVVERRAEPGQAVISELRSEPLLVLAESGRMRVRAELPAAQLAAVKEGQKVQIRLDGQSRDGSVEHIGLEPLRREGEPLYALDVALPLAENETLRAGLPATVVLP